MRKLILLPLLLLGWALSAQNPVFPGWYADPDVIVEKGECWIYPTSSNGAPRATYFDCFSSRDLVNWEKHECILDTASVSWAWKAMWAPCVIKKDKKFYMFFSANDAGYGKPGGIGVAVADNPAGPFTEPLGRPLLEGIHNGAQAIDQCVFRDDDGQYYMYYGGWGHCNVVKLSNDLMSIVPFEDGTIYKEITPEKYVEGPYMFKYKGKYYFMWSEGAWTGPMYSVAYAIADSPLGPFKRIDKILQQDPEVGTGAGHHSVLKIGRKWYIVYHRHPLNDKEGTHRYVCIDRMEIDKDGYIKPVRITVEGVGKVKVK